MNLFAQQIKFEDTEGLDLPEGQLITEGDEGESVAAAVAEVTEEEAGIAEDERAMDGLVEDEETLSEVQEVVEDDAPKMEHTGLTPVVLVLLRSFLLVWLVNATLTKLFLRWNTSTHVLMHAMLHRLFKKV